MAQAQTPAATIVQSVREAVVSDLSGRFDELAKEVAAMTAMMHNLNSRIPERKARAGATNADGTVAKRKDNDGEWFSKLYAANLKFAATQDPNYVWGVNATADDKKKRGRTIYAAKTPEEKNKIKQLRKNFEAQSANAGAAQPAPVAATP